MYTTITIRKETKEMLEKIKGKESWDSFLRDLAKLRRRLALMRLRELNKDRAIPLSEMRVKEWGRKRYS